MVKIYRELLGDYFDTITDEINFNRAGDVLVVKKLTGTNFKSALIQPVQLQAYVTDINKYFDILQSFARANSNEYAVDGLSFIKQNYETPQILNMWSESDDNYYATIVVNGILIISSELSDIKTIKIDGDVVEFDTANLIYAGAVNVRKPRGENKSVTQIIGGANSLTVNLINKVSPVLQKVRRVRRGDDRLNITFNIEITYIDDDYVENYVMVLTGAGMEASASNMPLLTLTFSE